MVILATILDRTVWRFDFCRRIAPYSYCYDFIDRKGKQGVSPKSRQYSISELTTIATDAGWSYIHRGGLTPPATRTI